MFAINSLAQNSASDKFRLQGMSVRTNLDFKKNKWAYSIHFICVNLYSFWVLLGVLFYKYYNNWTFSTAFYYALEAGLSIGFCYPVEKDDISKAFTIVYVLVGSSIIAGSLGALMTQYFYFKRKLENEYSSGFLPIVDVDTQKYTLSSVKNYVWFEFKLAIGWYHNRSRACCMIAFLIWMALGTAYGVHVEKWTIITSIYWAVTSASTGGLQSATCLPGTFDTDCDMGVLRGILMGTYFLLGVPIYAYTMSHFSGMLISKALEERSYDLLSKPIEESEFLYAANILSPIGSQTLNTGEFILFQMLRLGLTSIEQIEHFKADFERLDIDKMGVIDIKTFRDNNLSIPSKPRRYQNSTFVKISNLLGTPLRSSSSSVLSPTKAQVLRLKRESSEDSSSRPTSISVISTPSVVVESGSALGKLESESFLTSAITSTIEKNKPNFIEEENVGSYILDDDNCDGMELNLSSRYINRASPYRLDVISENGNEENAKSNEHSRLNADFNHEEGGGKNVRFLNINDNAGYDSEKSDECD